MEYINSKKVSRMELSYEKESEVFQWSEKGTAESNKNLFSLFKKVADTNIQSGYVIDSFTGKACPYEIISEKGPIKIDRSGEFPLILEKAKVTVYFDHINYTRSYFQTDSLAQIFADELASISGCDFLMR